MAELKVIINGQARGLNNSLDEVDKRVGKTSSVIAGLATKIAGAFTIGAVANFAREVFRVAGEVSDASDSLGVSPRALQSFQVLGQNAGLTAEKIEAAMTRIVTARTEALGDPDSAAAKSFARMGIEADKLRSMSPEDTLEAIGRAALEGASDAQKMAAVMDLIGNRSKRMVGALQELGRIGFAGASQDLDVAVQTMDDKTIKAMDWMGDDFAAKWRTLRSGVGNIIAAAAGQIGLAPEDRTEDNDRLRRTAQEARKERSRLAGQEALRAQMESEGPVTGTSRQAAALLAANAAATLRQSSLSDSLLRIGGGTGVGTLPPPDRNVTILQSIDTTLKAVQSNTAVRLR